MILSCFVFEQSQASEILRLSHLHALGKSNTSVPVSRVSFDDGASTKAWLFTALAPDTGLASDWFQFDGPNLMLRRTVVGELGNHLRLTIRADADNRPVIEQSFDIAIVSTPPTPKLLISEFMAINRNGIRDSGGKRSDWIEVHNPGPQAINLNEFTLTDDPGHLSKWRFPKQLIQPGAYQIVFAVGDTASELANSDSALVADFKLSANGEYLALVEVGGTVEHEFSPAYRSQIPDVSYGLDEFSNPRYFTRPTPGAENRGPSFAQVLPPVLLSHERGFYRDEILLRLVPANGGSTVRYTLDGSVPSKSHGTLYRNPIAIASTTVLKVLSFKADALPSEIQTHSYLFLDNIANQASQPEGYPNQWGQDNEVPGRTVAADYAMDPRVVKNTIPGYSLTDALLDLPSLSVTLPVDDLFSPSRGIYTHPRERGNAWERRCSLEWIEPRGGEGFQVNSQIEIHGNSSRRPWRMQKHSFRLTFLGSLGTDRLRFPLFKDSPVDRFNKLILRACFTDSWGLVSWGPDRYRPNDSQYIRDIWMKESFREMGHPSSHGDWVHLYLNGLYWGIYNITERLDEDFFADHLGGNPEDWEIMANFSGNSVGWNRMLAQLRNLTESSSLNPIEALLDVENFIDYLILHFYGDAEDWPHQNGYAARNAAMDKPFQFFVWDQEIALDNHRMQRYSSAQRSKPGEMFQLLRRTSEFRCRFADRVNHHLFGNGGLRLADSQARYSRIAQRIDKAIVAESARWGDTQMSTPYGNRIQQPSNPRNVDSTHYPTAPNGPDYYFTREDSWLVERENVIQNYLPAIYDSSRSDSLLSELRSNRLYPDLGPPIASPDGGTSASFEITLSAPDGGEIYYTLDGTDPQRTNRSQTKTIDFFDEDRQAYILIPSSSEPGREWVTESFDHSDWFSGPIGFGYETTGNDFSNWILADVGAMREVTASLYSRIPFTVSPSIRLDLHKLELSMRYDDGFVAFLNGTRIAEDNAPLGIRWNSTAKEERSKSDAIQLTKFDLTDRLGLLKAGENVLAIQGLNASATSPEFLIIPQLTGATLISLPPDDNPGLRYSRPIQLTETTTIHARSLKGVQWSPLTKASYFVGIPATKANLVISEVYYHPIEHPDAEFIRIENIHPTHSLDLSTTSFIQGIQFIVPKGQFLSPSESAFIVKSTPVFREHFGEEARIIGEFKGSLNNGGETLQLIDAKRENIAAFKYNDVQPWPTEAGGLGSGLTLIKGDQSPNDPKSWVGIPPLSGLTDNTIAPHRPLNGEEDSDRDGLSALLEYALGTSDLDPLSGPDAISYSAEPLPDGPAQVLYFFIRFQRNPEARSTFIVAELSHDLTRPSWETTELTSVPDDPEAPHWTTMRSSEPILQSQQAFIRIRAE